MPNWLNVGIAGTGYWPSEETRVTVGGHELILKPGTGKTEHSAHIELRGLTEAEAYTLIN